jgi:hypothetical protein
LRERSGPGGRSSLDEKPKNLYEKIKKLYKKELEGKDKDKGKNKGQR